MRHFYASQAILKHIYEKHKDLIKILNIKNIDELKTIIINVLWKPDEIYLDKYRSNVKYYLKRINDLWINIILIGNIVKTAYLISSKSYKRYRDKRWL